MKALELAKAVEHWVSCDAGIRGEECRAAAAELRRLAEVNAELLEALHYIAKFEDYDNAVDAANYAANAIAKTKEQQ